MGLPNKRISAGGLESAGGVGAAIAAVAAAATLATRLDSAIVAVVATLLVTSVAALLLFRWRVRVYQAGSSFASLDTLLDRQLEQRQQAQWFVHMRWVAIVVSLGLILAAVPVGHFLPLQALPLLASWWSILLVANALFQRWTSVGSHFELQIMVQGILDLVVLTGFLNASGGIENPVYFAYLFHIIIAGILLPKRKALALTIVAGALFSVMTVGEYAHVLPHFTNRLFPHEQLVASTHSHGAEAGAEHVTHASHGAMFVAGRTIPFLALLALSAYLTNLVAGRLNRRESQLRAAGQTLMLEHQRLERVVESTGVGMMLVAPDLTIPWMSSRAARWMGLPGESLDGRCPLYQAPNGCSRCIVQETSSDGVARDSERSFRSPQGGRRYFRHAASPVLDAEGRTLQVVELLEDITDRKILEAEAMHAGKLSALGQMAAGVAHEIGNPLSSLATRLALIERRPEPDYVVESVGLLRRQIERIRRIVHGVSLFARNRRQEWSTWSLNDVARETLEFARLDSRAKRIRLEARLAEPAPMVRGVKDQITQVLLNLVLNAAEATDDGGEVAVETGEKDGFVLLRVEDHGAGIQPDHLSRLFEPFFSTKTKGTGLGLAICHSLINAHGGRIEVDSVLERGSTFTVYLPASVASETRVEGHA